MIDYSRLISEIEDESAFVLLGNIRIRSLKKLSDILPTLPDSSFFEHVNDSKNDFSNWIRHCFNDELLADRILKLKTKEEIAEAIKTRVGQAEHALRLNEDSVVKLQDKPQELNISQKIDTKDKLDEIKLDNITSSNNINTHSVIGPNTTNENNVDNYSINPINTESKADTSLPHKEENNLKQDEEISLDTALDTPLDTSLGNSSDTPSDASLDNSSNAEKNISSESDINRVLDNGSDLDTDSELNKETTKLDANSDADKNSDLIPSTESFSIDDSLDADLDITTEKTTPQDKKELLEKLGQVNSEPEFDELKTPLQAVNESAINPVKQHELSAEQIIEANKNTDSKQEKAEDAGKQTSQETEESEDASSDMPELSVEEKYILATDNNKLSPRQVFRKIKLQKMLSSLNTQLQSSLPQTETGTIYQEEINKQEEYDKQEKIIEDNRPPVDLLNISDEEFQSLLGVNFTENFVATVSDSNIIKTKKRRHLMTGVGGFDDLIDKGILEGSSVLVSGGPGSGKTTFCIQQLGWAAEHGEKCLFISLEEKEENLIEHMKGYGLNPEKYFKAQTLKIKKLDSFKLARSVEALLAYARGELLIDIEPVLDIIPDNFKPDRVVIDSLSSIAAAFAGKPEDYRIYVEQLFNIFDKLGVTSFIITEIQGSEISGHGGVEDFLADGVINFYNMKKGTVRQPAVEVLKMRGVNHKKKIVPFAYISGKGIEVYPLEEVFHGNKE